MSNSLVRDILAEAHKPRCAIPVRRHTAKVRPGVQAESAQEATKKVADALDQPFEKVWAHTQILIDSGKLVFSHGRLIATGHGKWTARGEKVRDVLQAPRIFARRVMGSRSEDGIEAPTAATLARWEAKSEALEAEARAERRREAWPEYFEKIEAPAT